MEIQALEINGAFEIVPRKFADSRGEFFEFLRTDRLAEHTGRNFLIRQANTSISHRGVFRGIHFAQIPIGQAKYVTVPSGAIIDYVVDIRVESPTYGQWCSVELSADNRKSVFISEGLGHAFVALQDNTTVSYLVSDVFRPEKEFGITPFDEQIGLVFPFPADSLVVSDKDIQAPTLEQAHVQGLLPSYTEVLDFYAQYPPREK